MKERMLYRGGWLLILLFCVFLFILTADYLDFEVKRFLTRKKGLEKDLLWRISFYIHITGSMLALLLGPLQFLPAFRNKNLRLHRQLGKVYIGGILFLGAPAGLFMSFYANGGMFAISGFILLSFLWLLSTWKALESARNRQFTEHKKWMTRSFCLTFAAVTLRLWVPFLSYGFDADFAFTEMISPWIAFVPNLIVAELLLRLRPGIL